MPKKITCVYTALGLQDRFAALLKEALGEDIVLHHIIESGFIADVVKAGGVTEALQKRLDALLDAAVLTAPDLIIVTCSSIGLAAERYAAAHPEIPLLRIDYPMARTAALTGKRIAVLATLSTTVEPSVELVERLAREARRSVQVFSLTADGAYLASKRGEKEYATSLVRECVLKNCPDADTVVLAQASMAMFRDMLREILPEGTLILESPATCAAYLKEFEW